MLIVKVVDYERHAVECRKMARADQNPTHKKQLEDMAEAWEMLARTRLKQLHRQPIDEPAREAREAPQAIPGTKLFQSH